MVLPTPVWQRSRTRHLPSSRYPSHPASMLRTYVALQVIGCFIADGILTPESIPLPFFPKKASINNKNNSWHLLLKSATFRTLSKYTYFSPSLDIKMEADALLWEKLEGAKYIQKLPKQQEEVERVRTGLLVDMTRESGYLEFRQTETSRYNFEPRDHRILTLWKIQKLGQKHYIILIKIPQNPQIEDKYEYNLKDGLKELDTKDGSYTNRQNKNSSWRSEDNKNARAIQQHEGDHTIERQDSYVITPQPTNPNKYKVTNNYKINKATPQTYVFKPTQYYTLLGFQTPPPPAPVTTYSTWNQPNDYYTVGNYKIFPEFKQEEDYNGFVPSLGPTGTPVYQSSPLEPIAYKQIDNYYPTYPSPQIVTTRKPIPITYFKPSAEFIQYSEADPFYTTDENHAYSPTVTAEMPTANPTSPTIREYQQIIYKSPLTSIVIDVPPLKPGESLYDSAVNTIKNKTLLRENAEPTSTTLVVNYPKHYNNINEKQISTAKTTKETALQIQGSSTTEKTTKIRVKNISKSPHLSSITKNDNYDNYAPLYIRWGEKIKPSDNRTKTTTPKSVKIQAQKGVSNKPKEIIAKEKIIDLASTKEKDSISVANETKQSTPSTELPTSEPVELNTTNYIISNITVKSPEEIVRDLTTMGLVNATVIVSGNGNEHFKTDELEKLEIELPGKNEDNQEDGSEPISVVVNRISQSYSYKTAVGHIGNLKQLPEKT